MEAALLEQGARQADPWGINLYQRLPQLDARPGAADTRLAAKSPERFAL